MHLPFTLEQGLDVRQFRKLTPKTLTAYLDSSRNDARLRTTSLHRMRLARRRNAVRKDGGRLIPPYT